ncbi:MAG: MFS transporter [Pseudomonadota bacterium]
MFGALLSKRTFLPLFICQFLSALNDNFIKNALVILVLYRVGAENGGLMVTLAGATLIAPFFFLSALGGELADKYDKARVARVIKVCEIPIAALAAYGFLTASTPVLFAALFGFGCMAALFGPLKYGILPDHLATEELSAANALVEGATFLAILGGTILGGIAMLRVDGEPLIPLAAVSVVIIVLATLGFLSARLIPPTGNAQPELPITRNPLASTFRLIGELRADRTLWRGAMITSMFWFAGIVALALLPTLVKTDLGGSEDVVTAGLCVFVVGIAVGSWAAAGAAHGKPNLALAPFGALGMGLFSMMIAGVVAVLPDVQTTVLRDVAMIAQSQSGMMIAVGLFGLAASGGLLVVPVFAAVQAWSPVDRRARTIAGVNILNAAFMTGGSLGLAGLQVAGFGSAILFALLGTLMLATAALIPRREAAWAS